MAKKTNNKKATAKTVKRVAKVKNAPLPITDESSKIQNSKIEYTNCVVYKIENASFGMQPSMENMMKMPTQQMKAPTEEQVEMFQKQMIDHISVVTGFSTELVERVIQEANEFMDRNFGDGPEL